MSSGREKRSVTLYGHSTSVALEPEFWAVIDIYVEMHEMSCAGLIKQLDDKRIDEASPLGLAAYLRVWALKHVQSA